MAEPVGSSNAGRLPRSRAVAIGPAWLASPFGGNSMITVSFNIAKQDVVALACNYYASSASLKTSRTKGQLAIVLVMVGIGVVLYTLGEELRMASVVPFLCAPVLAAMYPRYYRQRLRQAAEAFVSESSYEKAFGDYTLTLREDCLRSTSPVGESRFVWAAVRRVALTPGHLFIFLTGPQGWAIPRPQVPDNVIRELQTFAESHAGITEPVAPHDPPPRGSVSHAPDDGMLDPLPAPDSGGGR